MASQDRPKRTFLLDTSLMDIIDRRRAIVELMAKDLVASGELASDRDAERLLSNLPYSLFDIAVLAGEARRRALEQIVARERRKP